MSCANCGMLNHPEAPFCQMCGRPLLNIDAGSLDVRQPHYSAEAALRLAQLCAIEAAWPCAEDAGQNPNGNIKPFAPTTPTEQTPEATRPAAAPAAAPFPSCPRPPHHYGRYPAHWWA